MSTPPRSRRTWRSRGSGAPVGCCYAMTDAVVRMEGALMIRASREFTSDLPQLAELRRFVSDVVRRVWPDAPPDLLAQLGLALQEAAVNVVIHAYQREPGRPIYADLEIDDERLAVTLTHQGRDFDPAAVPPPDFDGSRTGGFGVHLIRQIMD